MALATLGWTTVVTAGFADGEQRPEHLTGSTDISYRHERARFDVGACYLRADQWMQAQLAQKLVEPTHFAGYAEGAGYAKGAAADYPDAALALVGDSSLPDSSSPLRLEAECNVARTPLGEIVLRGSIATTQPVAQATAQGIVTTFGAHRLFQFSLGPIGARANAMAQYTNLNLGRAGFGDVYSLESGLVSDAGKHLELGLRYRGNYDEWHLATPDANPPGSWLHQFSAVTNWHKPVTYGAFSVNASAGYFVDQVAGISQNGGWLIALDAQYPVSRNLSVVAGSGYNDRECRPYVTRDLMLIDRPENTWSSNFALRYAASARTSMRLDWVGFVPASQFKPFSYESSKLLFSVTTSY